MGFFTDNPVLEREVRGRLRLRRKGAGRAIPVVAWPIALVAFYFYARGLSAIGRGTSRDAQDLLPVLVYGVLTLIVLLAPALASTAITQEREQQTWDALATTRLSAWEILFGKWVGRQLIPWLMIALAFPYLLTCTVRGELGAALLPATLVFLVVTTTFYSALGLLCSFQARRTAGATATALTVTALLCVGTLVVDQVIGIFMSHPGQRGNSSVLWLNPFFALNALLSWLDQSSANQGGSGYPVEPNPLVAGSYLLVSVAATGAALRFMVSRYQQAVRERT
jgi:ABC-type transport system involved in multi-copper enzyme maturation permease subunit